VAEQSYQVVLAVISGGLSISQVAEKAGARCSGGRLSSSRTTWRIANSTRSSESIVSMPRMRGA
jgi:hypothetical protein